MMMVFTDYYRVSTLVMDFLKLTLCVRDAHDERGNLSSRGLPRIVTMFSEIHALQPNLFTATNYSSLIVNPVMPMIESYRSIGQNLLILNQSQNC